MVDRIKLVSNTAPQKDPQKLMPFCEEEVHKVQNFHKSFPEYEPTPLVDLKALAHALGAASIQIKDESYRFGLNAFKVLGGSYCIGKYIADRLEMDIGQLSYETMISPETREKLGKLHFVTATDGNHGRGIAWAVNRIGQECTVYLPKGSAQERLENIRALGADAWITELNYDDSVRLAAHKQETEGWVMVQDTAWTGYEEIPKAIMQGYTTMAAEAVSQMDSIPTHIFLQAGVGAMAGALTAFFAAYYQEKKPVITIVEPNGADCIFRTAQAADGKIHVVEGDLPTIMAGLACGEPCTIGWDILKGYADHFVSIPDEVAARGMRILGNPLGQDQRVISGESGASALGLVATVLMTPELTWLKEKLALDQDSRILCISTEGDTDRENYRRIVWDGLTPSF